MSRHRWADGLRIARYLRSERHSSGSDGLSTSWSRGLGKRRLIVTAFGVVVFGISSLGVIPAVVGGVRMDLLLFAVLGVFTVGSVLYRNHRARAAEQV